MLFKQLKKMKILFCAKTVVLKKEYELFNNKTNNSEFKEVEFISKFVPLREVFTKLFNNSIFLKKFILCLKDKTNYVNTPFFQSKMNNVDIETGVLYVPINAFFDEMEPLNCLGSHSSLFKTGAVYVNIPALSDDILSKLYSIFLTMLFHAEEITFFGMNKLLEPFVDEINYLFHVGIELKN